MKFSEKIVFMRKKRKISQDRLAKKMGVSRQTIYKWEADLNTPEFNKIEKLAEILDISYNLLLDDSIDLEKYFQINEDNNENVECNTEESIESEEEKIETSQKKNDSKIMLILGVSVFIIITLIATVCGLAAGFSKHTDVGSSDSSDLSSDNLRILKISYNANGGVLKGGNTSDVAYGSVIGTLPIPEKNNHLFLGWFDDEGNEVTESTVLTKDIYLTAKYQKTTAVVYFNANGGYIDEDERTVIVGEKIGTLPTPVWEGHLFLYWKTNNRIINSDTIVDVDTLVSAVWKSNEDIVSLTLCMSDTERVQIWVGKNELLKDQLPIPNSPDALEFLGWFTEKGVLVTKSTKFSENTVLKPYFGSLEICPANGEKHSWSEWDEENIIPTCSKDGTKSRYCYDCFYKVNEISQESLGHNFSEWSYDRMEQNRHCIRCFQAESIKYVNLSARIEETKITGDVYMADNWTCLYDGDWEQEYPVFCGKNNPVTVDITLKEANYVDCIFVKGLSDCTYAISVLYEGEDSYTVISDEGKFGETAMRFDINGNITSVKIHMPYATPDGYWQEVAIAQIPEVE